MPFGKYLLDREIARGGMARVFLARLRGLGGFEKRLVVKQILPHLAEDPRFVEMFVHEARTLVALSHPHVVPVYELGIEGGVYFLAMEHVEGATLAEILEDGPLSHAEAAHVGVQIADALAYADERFGLVHRDVTPRNVMIDGSGHSRLLDFGIAARADASTDAGGLYGTPGYLSPEQARGEKVTQKSDLFSLGCVLFEAMTARAVLPGQDLGPVRALTGDDVARLVPGDDELARIVRLCLAPRPEDRPESARVLGRMLRAVSSGAEDPARTLGTRAETAQVRARSKEIARRSGAGRSELGATPTSDPARARSATLATSQLLGALLESPAADTPGTAKIEAPRTAKIDRPRGVVSSSEGDAVATERSGEDAALEATPGTVTSARPAPAPVGWPAVLLAAAVLGGLAAFLSARATLDPPVPDASEVLTDTDGTTWIPPEDTGPDAGADAGVADAGSDAATDAGLDAGRVESADAGRPEGRRALLRVTSDGNLTVRVDGRVVGHAPVITSATPGERRLDFVCELLGRTASARIEAGAGQTVRVRVTCNTGGTPSLRVEPRAVWIDDPNR